MRRHEAVLRFGVSLALIQGLIIYANAQATQHSTLPHPIWPCLRGDTRNTGQSSWRAPISTIAWVHETAKDQKNALGIFTSPALDGIGTIYVANRRLQALDAATGNRKWEFTDCPLVSGSPALGNDNNLFVGGADAFLYALNSSTGKVRWRYKTAHHILSAPALDRSNVYIGCETGTLYALDAHTGKPHWTFNAKHGLGSSPMVGVNGLIYCQDWGTLYALRCKDGKPVWTYQAADSQFSTCTPALENGVLFAAFIIKDATKNGSANVVALRSSVGVPIWKTKLPAYVYASPALGARNLLYIGCGDGKLYALDKSTGKIRWTFKTGDHIQSSPAISLDGTVYIGSYDKKLYAVNGRTGVKKWEFTTGGGIQSSPVVSADGTVFVGSLDGNVYAVPPHPRFSKRGKVVNALRDVKSKVGVLPQ